MIFADSSKSEKKNTTDAEEKHFSKMSVLKFRPFQYHRWTKTKDIQTFEFKRQKKDI